MTDASGARVLVFGGSLRRGSYNHRLALAAAEGARAAGASVTELVLRDYPLPVFDEDLEAADGLPPNAIALKDLFKAHHGLIVGVPEYNSAISGALKNAIDWVSRPREGESPLECFDQKVVGLVAASPGALGGIRGLPVTRAIFGHIKAIVLPEQCSVPLAHEAFDDKGNLKDDRQREMAQGVGRRVAEVAAAVGRVSA